MAACASLRLSWALILAGTPNPLSTARCLRVDGRLSAFNLTPSSLFPACHFRQVDSQKILTLINCQQSYTFRYPIASVHTLCIYCVHTYSLGGTRQNDSPINNPWR